MDINEEKYRQAVYEMDDLCRTKERLRKMVEFKLMDKEEGERRIERIDDLIESQVAVFN